MAIVGGHLKTNLVVSDEYIVALDVVPQEFRFSNFPLINKRLMQPDLLAPQVRHEVAMRINGRFGSHLGWRA